MVYMRLGIWEFPNVCAHLASILKLKRKVMKYNQSLLNGIRFDMQNEKLRNQRYFDMKTEFEISD